MNCNHVRCCVVVLAAAQMLPAIAAGQQSDSSGRVPMAAYAGGDTENYLRILQTLGVVAPYPWSIRAFSPRELERLRPRNAGHPLAARPEFSGSSASRSFAWGILPAELAVQHNSGFPYGMNDGPVWAGRGLTYSMQLGAAIRWKAVSLVVAPIYFRAENRAFALAPTGQAGQLQYADPTSPNSVDRPQRFGDRPYAQLDPGQTSLRVDAFGVTAGASTANQWWGPAIDYAFLLGSNAAGFPHFFLGTRRPYSIWIGSLHARVVYGELSQTEYTTLRGLAARRFASGIVGSFSPRGMPGLEIGGARFYHTQWPEGGLAWRHFRKPLEGLLKAKLVAGDPTRIGTDATNQLASLFFRWMLPKSGFEIYGEYGREDHSWDKRDLILEPDHESTFGLGFRKAWARGPRRIIALRGEILDFRTPVLWRHRTTQTIYVHTVIGQGHTHRGQLLGADVGVRSSQGLGLVAEHYAPSGRLSLSWRSRIRRDGDAPLMNPDVEHAVSVEHVFLRGPLELAIGGGGAYDFNRDHRDDGRNFFGTLKLRWRPYAPDPQ